MRSCYIRTCQVYLSILFFVAVSPSSANFVESPHGTNTKALEGFRFRASQDLRARNDTAPAKVARSSEGIPTAPKNEPKQSLSRRLFAAEESNSTKAELKPVKITQQQSRRSAEKKTRSPEAIMKAGQKDDRKAIAPTAQLTSALSVKTQKESLATNTAHTNVLQRLAPVLLFLQVMWTRMKDMSIVSLFCSKLPTFASRFVPATPIRAGINTFACESAMLWSDALWKIVVLQFLVLIKAVVRQGSVIAKSFGQVIAGREKAMVPDTPVLERRRRQLREAETSRKSSAISAHITALKAQLALAEEKAQSLHTDRPGGRGSSHREPVRFAASLNEEEANAWDRKRNGRGGARCDVDEEVVVLAASSSNRRVSPPPPPSCGLEAGRSAPRTRQSSGGALHRDSLETDMDIEAALASPRHMGPPPLFS